MPRLRRPSRMWGTAAAASSRSTVMRTSSEPARERAATWAIVPSISAVSVLVMDCTTIGAPPPTATLPTMTCVVLCRGLGPATSERRVFSGLFMATRLSGFGDIQQRIGSNGDYATRPINQKKSCNYKHGRRAEHGSQHVMHDDIAGHDAKQRGDEGKCRQFARRVGLNQCKPQRKSGSDHP